MNIIGYAMWESPQTLFAILLIIILILSFCVAYLMLFVYKWKKMMADFQGKTVETKLEQFFTQNLEIKNRLLKLEKDADFAYKEKQSFFQKSAFLRFNPFGDTGGDQSFIWVLLDAHDNGVILSALHGRGGTRVYAKEVEKGLVEKHRLS